jgi:hypothetical protein
MRAIGLTLMVMGVICGLAALRFYWVRGEFIFGDVVTIGLSIGLLVGGRIALNRSASDGLFELTDHR